MDTEMPVMNGADALRIPRSQEAFASVPIVAFTADALEKERRAKLLQGFDEVSSKPCFPHDLVTAVRRLTEPNRTATAWGYVPTGDAYCAAGPRLAHQHACATRTGCTRT